MQRQPHDPKRVRSGKPLIYVAALLVTLALLVVFVLWPRKRARPPVKAAREPVHAIATPGSARAPAPPMRARATTATAPVRAPSPEPLDLFTGDLPELVRMSHEVVQRGGMLRAERMKELYELGKASPGDPRPQLVLGADAMNRGWHAFAVDHYRHAFAADAKARQDPRMLKDLVAVAGLQHGGDKGQAAVREIYGGGALQAVEAAAAEAAEKGDLARAERLTNFAASLEDAPP